MTCVVCQKPFVTCEKPRRTCFTCSMQCAGKLSHSVRIANLQKQQYKTKEKQQVREFLFKRYVKPVFSCEEPERNCFTILDLWGGGLFSDFILDQNMIVKNQQTIVKLYEIEKDKDLHPALLKYAREKNQQAIVKNQIETVSPFCGSLAKFVQGRNVKNHPPCDLIWLDYCKTIGPKEEKDIQLIEQISDINTVIVISFFIGGNPKWVPHRMKQSLAFIQNEVKAVFPFHHLDHSVVYGGMGVLMFKLPARLKKILPKGGKHETVENFNRISA